MLFDKSTTAITGYTAINIYNISIIFDKDIGMAADRTAEGASINLKLTAYFCSISQFISDLQCISASTISKANTFDKMI